MDKKDRIRNLKKILKLYREEEDATDFGSYRDLITDALHLLRTDKTAQKICPLLSGKPDLFYPLQEAWDVFQEECLNAEIETIDKAARKNELPMLVNRKWEFSDAEIYYKDKMKNL